MTQYLTPEGLEKLKKELQYLETTKRQEVAEKLNTAISFGDISENAAYDEAKEAQGFLEGRIMELKEIISSAKIIKKHHADEIQLGSTVLLCSNDQKEKYQIVGPEEADVFNGKISYQSPLGKIILGKRKGSKVIVKTMDGETEYKILEVS